MKFNFTFRAGKINVALCLQVIYEAIIQSNVINLKRWMIFVTKFYGTMRFVKQAVALIMPMINNSIGPVAPGSKKSTERNKISSL